LALLRWSRRRCWDSRPRERSRFGRGRGRGGQRGAEERIEDGAGIGCADVAVAAKFAVGAVPGAFEGSELALNAGEEFDRGRVGEEGDGKTSALDSARIVR